MDISDKLRASAAVSIEQGSRFAPQPVGTICKKKYVFALLTTEQRFLDRHYTDCAVWFHADRK
jgi:hypothetical protein